MLESPSLRVRNRISDIRFPDGIAYAAEAGKIFVSDEFGQRDVVVDARSDSGIGVVALGGEAGNTQYDSVGRRIWVAVQTRNQLVAIDPASDSIVGRYDLPGGDHPHGLFIDAPHRLAFVACEGNATLLVFDLTSMRVTATLFGGRRSRRAGLRSGITATVRGGGVGRSHRFRGTGAGAPAPGRVPGSGGALGVGRSGNPSSISATGERGRPARPPDPVAPVT